MIAIMAAYFIYCSQRRLQMICCSSFRICFFIIGGIFISTVSFSISIMVFHNSSSGMLLSSFLNFPISEEVIPFSMYWQYNFLNCGLILLVFLQVIRKYIKGVLDFFYVVEHRKSQEQQVFVEFCGVLIIPTESVILVTGRK